MNAENSHSDIDLSNLTILFYGIPILEIIILILLIGFLLRAFEMTPIFVMMGDAAIPNGKRFHAYGMWVSFRGTAVMAVIFSGFYIARTFGYLSDTITNVAPEIFVIGATVISYVSAFLMVVGSVLTNLCDVNERQSIRFFPLMPLTLMTFALIAFISIISLIPVVTVHLVVRLFWNT